MHDKDTIKKRYALSIYNKKEVLRQKSLDNCAYNFISANEYERLNNNELADGW